MLRNKSFQNQLIQTARVLNEVLSLNAQESHTMSLLLPADPLSSMKS